MNGDTQHKIGTTFVYAERDAIHIAVLPVKAHRKLIAGEWVGVADGVTTDGKSLGVIDPFLVGGVEKGQMCFLFLKPNTITSLRHEWTHPEIPDEQRESKPSKEESEKWIRKWIENSGAPQDYEWLMRVAALDPGERVLPDGMTREDASYAGSLYHYGEKDGGYMHFGGSDAHGDIPEEFWEHAENVLGRKLARVWHFSCSC